MDQSIGLQISLLVALGLIGALAPMVGLIRLAFISTGGRDVGALARSWTLIVAVAQGIVLGLAVALGTLGRSLWPDLDSAAGFAVRFLLAGAITAGLSYSIWRTGFDAAARWHDARES